MSTYNDEHIIREKVSPGYERTIARLENLMVVVCDFTNGPMLHPQPPHSHPHEQITYVAEGKLFFHKGESVIHLKKGDLLTVCPDLPHCIQTISTHVRLIDSFHPVRQDFLNQK